MKKTAKVGRQYGLDDTGLLCELAAHLDFPRLMADLEIYVNGTAVKQVQNVNAIVDAMSATIMKQHNPGLSGGEETEVESESSEFGRDMKLWKESKV